jgi:outer membrane murein-binding lipoprotein Lpp
MKRFLMLVGVAVVAAAMYVAASPASQQAKAPTAKQFKALKAQVAKLSKTLKTVKAEADASVEYIGACFLTSSATIANLPVSQFGTSTSGFWFGPSDGSNTVTRGALVEDPVTTQAYLQEVNKACLTAGAMRHGAPRSIGRLQLWAHSGR